MEMTSSNIKLVHGVVLRLLWKPGLQRSSNCDHLQCWILPCSVLMFDTFKTLPDLISESKYLIREKSKLVWYIMKIKTYHFVMLCCRLKEQQCRRWAAWSGGTSPPPGWSCHWPARTVRCHSSHRTCARSSWHPTWQPQCCRTLDAGSSESNWMFCCCCTPTLHEPWILKSKVSFLIM